VVHGFRCPQRLHKRTCTAGWTSCRLWPLPPLRRAPGRSQAAKATSTPCAWVRAERGRVPVLVMAGAVDASMQTQRRVKF